MSGIQATFTMEGIITLIGLSLAVYWLRRAFQFKRITRKLHAHEPLTSKEQRLLDQAGQR